MKTKVQTRKSKRNYLIVALIVVVLLLGVGYAAFSETLTISGTATGTATWDVKFTAAEVKKWDGTASTAVADSTATISGLNTTALTVSPSSLLYPGDSRKITATITNGSSMDIVLTDFEVTGPTDSKITFTTPTLTENTCKISAGQTATFTFVVAWDANATITDGTTVGEAKAADTGDYQISFTYTQDTGTASTFTASHTDSVHN